MTAIVEQREELVRLEVDGTPSIAYPRLTGPVEVGDDVLVNVEARELQLGSGGFDVLYANLTRGLGLEREADAHVMRLPYTPLQVAVRHVEEGGSAGGALDGLPVVCCSLHSQVAAVCAGIGGGRRIAYVQLAGGALPVSLSDTIRVLKEHGLIESAVASGSCLDGDLHAVNVHSALAWAGASGFDAVVCGIGPGIVGTGSRLGHGGIAAADAANAASALGAAPILAARVSEADTRERHRGVSHHTRAALGLCLGPVVVAWPRGRMAPDWLEPRTEVDASGWQDACARLPLSHMGRGPDADPAFFESAYAAGVLARQALA